MRARVEWKLRSPLAAVLVAFAVLASLPQQAGAAFPGANGKIALTRSFDQGYDIWVVNPDGTGKVDLTTSMDNEQEPTWSPDGARIAYLFEGVSNAPYGIYVMNADGSEQTRISSQRYSPPGSWSPDGTRIVFPCTVEGPGFNEICTMRGDGSDVTRLTFNEAFESAPRWSPDGTEIAYTGAGGVRRMSADGTNDVGLGSGYYPEWSPDGKQIAFQSTELHGGSDIFVMDRDGGNRRPVTNDDNPDGPPAFSPDGTKLAFWRHGGAGIGGGIWSVNLDGTGLTEVVRNATRDRISWQPLGAFAPYPRPGGGTPLIISLVPAFAACDSPNSSHAPPLALPSCSPPIAESSSLTTSTAGRGRGGVTFYTLLGNPGTPDDEADVEVSAHMTDIVCASASAACPGGMASDFSGEAVLALDARITDRANGFGGVSGTAANLRFDIPLTCVATADALRGGTCAVDSTFDALVPGLAREGKRSVIGASGVRVLDPGPDGTVQTAQCPPSCGTGDETLYLHQGLFLP